MEALSILPIFGFRSPGASGKSFEGDWLCKPYHGPDLGILVKYGKSPLLPPLP